MRKEQKRGRGGDSQELTNVQGVQEEGGGRVAIDLPTSLNSVAAPPHPPSPVPYSLPLSFLLGGGVQFILAEPIVASEGVVWRGLCPCYTGSCVLDLHTGIPHPETHTHKDRLP